MKKYKYRDSNFDLIDQIIDIWNCKRMILRNAFYGLVVGVIIAFSIPKEYLTTVRMASESSSLNASGNVGALAAMAGFNLPNSTKDGLTPLLYPDIVSSTPFLEEFKDLYVIELNALDSIPLYSYLIENQKIAWWFYVIKSPFMLIDVFKEAMFKKDSDDTWNSFHLNSDQKNFLDILSERIIVTEDKVTGVISLSVKMQDPMVSAVLADSSVRKLQKYMINYKTEKSRIDLKYSEKLLNEATIRYNNAKIQLARFLDTNKNIVLASHLVEKENLENEVSLSFSVYSNLAQQVELAKAKVQQDTPVLTILEPSIVPLKAFSPNKIVVVLSCLFLFVVATLGYIIIRDILKKFK